MPSRERAEGAARAPDTIAAIATPAGRGGIGVVRVSGPDAARIARLITSVDLLPRVATLATFRDASGAPIDQGLALLFRAPHSYTGEEVLELQGHGGAAVMQLLLGECVAHGARLAEPGEFTRRAFLNERIDLAQAESVADLIDAESVGRQAVIGGQDDLGPGTGLDHPRRTALLNAVLQDAKRPGDQWVNMRLKPNSDFMCYVHFVPLAAQRQVKRSIGNDLAPMFRQ